MQERASEAEVELVLPPRFDEHGLPVAEPMSYDQADLALRLGKSLKLHRDRQGLVMHVELNDAVGYKDAEEQERWLFPDLYVVVGIPQLPAAAPFRTWILERSPSVVLEFSTKRSVRRDLGEKLRVYREELRVPEYFVFDVAKRKVRGLLEGFRLEGGNYQPISRATPSGPVRLHSQELELDLGVVVDPTAPGGHALRAFLPGDDVPLPTPDEAELREALRREEVARVEIERLRRALEDR